MGLLKGIGKSVVQYRIKSHFTQEIDSLIKEVMEKAEFKYSGPMIQYLSQISNQITKRDIGVYNQNEWLEELIVAFLSYIKENELMESISMGSVKNELEDMTSRTSLKDIIAKLIATKLVEEDTLIAISLRETEKIDSLIINATLKATHYKRSFNKRYGGLFD